MELSQNGTVVMSTCNGSRQQLWVWNRSASATADAVASFVRKEKSHIKAVESASGKRHQKVVQEIAAADY